MTSFTAIWNRWRPCLWPSSDDLNTGPKLSQDERIWAEVKGLTDWAKSLDERVDGLNRAYGQRIENVDGYYVKTATVAFLEHMAAHRQGVHNHINSFQDQMLEKYKRLADDLDGLKADHLETSARLSRALANLRQLGEG